MDFVKIEKQGRIAIVRFDRGTPANPMSQALLRELTAAAHSFDHDSETSAVVLTGRVDNFSMGADLKDPETATLREAGLAERRVRMMA
ncbi:MAG: enoyl-CoA hydratase/isomerase family protein, partial [Pseudomonadota bacterium]|nr:enoyl-CoA hydratase/isomerase family protein [Pseudomonadota bacterium]